MYIEVLPFVAVKLVKIELVAVANDEAANKYG